MVSTFEIYKALWLEETKYNSFPSYDNINYLKIIDMGKDVIPLIIEDIKTNGTAHWYFALNVLTGADPINKEHKGIIKLMNNDWIEWYSKIY